MGIARRNTAVIIDLHSIRQIFGEEIGGIVGFGRVWKEVHTRLAGTERDQRAQWEDSGFI